MNFTFKTVSEENKIQFKEKGSNFITFLFRVNNEFDFKKRLNELKTEFPDASHHCFAYRLDPSGNSDRSSDDGEPSGTAGKPILNQLLSADLHYCAIVIVRYFGGTKLGTGGLIKAYKTAAKTVIESARIQIEKEKRKYVLSFPFDFSSEVNRMIKALGAEIIRKEADENLHLEISIPLENVEIANEKCKNWENVSLTPVQQ